MQQSLIHAMVHVHVCHQQQNSYMEYMYMHTDLSHTHRAFTEYSTLQFWARQTILCCYSTLTRGSELRGTIATCSFPSHSDKERG